MLSTLRKSLLKVLIGGLSAGALFYGDYLFQKKEHKKQRDNIKTRLWNGYCDKPYYQEERFLVARKAERERLLKSKYLDPDENSRFYYVFSGPHGCGKSRLLKEVACELISKAKGEKKASGLIMTEVTTSQRTAVDIASAIGIASEQKPQTWYGQLRSHFGYGYTPLYTIPEDPIAAINFIGKALKEEGLKFKEKHGRPIMIGLDDVNVLTKSNDAQLLRLQHWAKKLADEGLVIFAFIDSAGIALKEMRRNPGRASRMKEVAIKDITEEEAITFLKEALRNCGISYERVYKELTGGRLQHLHRVREIVQTEVPDGRKYEYDDLYRRLINEVTSSSLQPCNLHTTFDKTGASPKIQKRQKLLKEIFREGELTTEKATTILEIGSGESREGGSNWGAELDLLIKFNILLYCDRGNKIRFHSKLVETALKEKLQMK